MSIKLSFSTFPPLGLPTHSASFFFSLPLEYMKQITVCFYDLFNNQKGLNDENLLR